MLIQKERHHETNPKQYQRVDIGLAVVIALVFHMVLLSAWFYYEGQVKPRNHSQNPVRIRMVSRDSVKKWIANAPKKIKPEPIPKKQTVSTFKPSKNERPKDADYVSEYDQKVEEQTKSSVNSPKPQQLSKPDVSETILQKGPNVLVPEQRAGPPKQNLKALQARENTARLNETKRGVLSPHLPEEAQEESMGESFDRSQGGHHLVNLVPSVEDLARYQASAFNDHLEDVEEDAQTRLNTFQWKHATYFNRIKETISQVWAPVAQIQRYDPQGIMLGQRDRYTIVLVSLNKEGGVVDVSVKTKSGVDYLDEEAVQAFQKAAHFPNPPSAVFGNAETFRFAFGFYVSFEKGFFSDFRF